MKKSAIKAFEIVEKEFDGVYDKGGSPYINHLIRVSSKIKDDQVKAAALLHDIIEDLDYSEESLLELGFSTYTVQLVVQISRKKNETYAEYIDRLIASGDKNLLTIKKYDLQDNMHLFRIRRPTQKDTDRVAKRYRPAYRKICDALDS